jgi:hypothetical protein
MRRIKNQNTINVFGKDKSIAVNNTFSTYIVFI